MDHDFCIVMTLKAMPNLNIWGLSKSMGCLQYCLLTHHTRPSNIWDFLACNHGQAETKRIPIVFKCEIIP